MKLRSAGYDVCFEDESFSHLHKFLRAHPFSNVFILCDSNTSKHCLPKFLRQLKSLSKSDVLIIPAGEKHKNIETVSKCWNFLLDKKADKKALLINLGGGVLCDTGGFAASTFKRGIAFINIPTTLLAMADASVGGKNGVDLNGYKNLVGTITQPGGVFIYEGFLKTLSKRELHSGYAEIVKAGLVGDKKLWKKFLHAAALPEKGMTGFISAAVEFKNRVVSKDPHEKNIRKILNFGHTAGHAIEAYFLNRKNSMLHGEAIVAGMCVELFLGRILNITHEKVVSEAVAFFKLAYKLPAFSEKEIESFILLMKQDKKNVDGKINFALVTKAGHADINIDANEDTIRSAFELYNTFSG